MVLSTSMYRMLSYAKSGTARTGDRLNGFKNGKTQQFNSNVTVLNCKMSIFLKKKEKKKVEYPFNKRLCQDTIQW